MAVSTQDKHDTDDQVVMGEDGLGLAPTSMITNERNQCIDQNWNRDMRKIRIKWDPKANKKK